MRNLTRNVDDERRASEIEANFQPKLASFDVTPDVKQLRDRQFAIVVDNAGTRLLVRIGNELKEFQFDPAYVQLSGDTMTGDLVLHAAPSVDLQASTKKYVDDAVAVPAPHTHLLAAGATDVSALPAEVNLLDLSGLSVGEILRATGASAAAWGPIQAGDLPSGIDATDIADGSVDNTEYQYLDGVSSDIQTQLDGKSATAHTHLLAAGATDVTALAAEVNLLDLAALSVGEVLRASGASSAAWGPIQASDLPSGIDAANLADGSVSNTEYQYLNGVSSGIQTQLDGKSGTAHTHLLAAGATDVTALVAELNLLDLAGLSVGEVLRATGANSAAWGTIQDGDLPSGRDASNIADGSVDNDEFQRLDGLTADIQGQIDGKADSAHTHLLAAGATDVTALASEVNLLDLSGLSVGEVLRATGAESAAWGAIQAGDLPSGIDAAKIADGTVSDTEYQYLGSVTSDIQTQLNGKSGTGHTHLLAAGATDVTATPAELNLLDLGGLTIGHVLRASGAAAAAFAAIQAGDLPTGIDAAKIADGSISNTEFQYLNGVSSAIQTQITNAQNDIDGFPDELKSLAQVEIQQLENIDATTISVGQWGVLGGLVATLTAAELNFVDGVTSDIQTQLNGKSGTGHTHLLAAGATDVTALPAEVNLLDLSGLSVGEVLRATGAAAASWGAIQAGDLPSGIDAAKIADGTVDNAEFQRLDGLTADIQGQIDGKSATGHTHLLAGGATDVTALPAEVNLLDLAGLSVGEVLRATGATSAAWGALQATDIALASWVDGTANQITVTDDADGTITLSTPQDIDTAAQVEFNTITGSGASSIGAVTFTGSGLDDMTTGGTFVMSWTQNIRVQIDGTGTPDTFKWSADGGTTWDGELVSVFGAAQVLGSTGITVAFAATTGHTVTDRWDFTCTPASGLADLSFGVRIGGNDVLLMPGTMNLFLGHDAGGGGVGSQTNNVGVGYQALYAIRTGHANVAVGAQAMRSNTTGYDNVAVGAEAMESNTTGLSSVAVGMRALRLQTSGVRNLAIGLTALASVTTGDDNVAVGYEALLNTTRGENLGVGSYAARANSSGTANVGIGQSSLLFNRTGDYNVALGYQAGRGVVLQSHSQNVLIGYRAGYSVRAGGHNIVIGYDERLPTGDTSDHLNIGSTVYGELSDQNVGIGGYTWGTNAKKVVGLYNDTPPSTSPANTVQAYSADYSGGHACLHLRNEDGDVIKLEQQNKGDYNNWGALTDVVDALVAMGIFDQA